MPLIGRAPLIWLVAGAARIAGQLDARLVAWIKAVSRIRLIVRIWPGPRVGGCGRLVSGVGRSARLVSGVGCLVSRVDWRGGVARIGGGRGGPRVVGQSGIARLGGGSGGRREVGPSGSGRSRGGRGGRRGARPRPAPRGGGGMSGG